MDKHNSYEVTITNSDIDPLWDDFVVRSPTAPHEQTSLWGLSQRHSGWRASRLIVRSGGEIVGGGQVLERPLGAFGWKVGYLNRGPLVALTAKDLTAAIPKYIKQYAANRRMAYLAVVLPYDAQTLQGELTAAQFIISPDFLPPVTAMRSTIVLDLAKNEDEILMQMRMSTRQNIRKGLKRGLTVRQGGADDVDTFKRLLMALCARRGVKSNTPLNSFVHELWSDFSQKCMSQLFISEHAGEPVAALWLITTGKWARAWRYGWSGEHAHAYPNELLYWEAIKWAKSNGYKFFDFFGFDTQYANSLTEGRTLPEAEICKISFFKQGFGGRVLPLYPNYCYFSNPVVRLCFRLGGARFLKAGLFRGLVKVPVRHV